MRITIPSSRRRRILTGAALAVALAPRAQAQAPVPPRPLTLDAVLARHAAAVGPVQRVATRRTTLLITGLAPFDIPVLVDAMRPNLLRKTMTLQGASQVTAFDGRSWWRVDPFASGTAVVPVPDAELPDLQEESEFDGPLLTRGLPRSRLRYAGASVVTIAGRALAVHSIHVTFPNGRETTVHLDATSFLEVLRTQTRPVMGRATAMELVSSDYRDVQGLKVPHLLEIRIAGMPSPIRIAVRAMQLDVPMRADAFARPARD